MLPAYTAIAIFVLFFNFFLFHTFGSLGIALLLCGFAFFQLILAKRFISKNLFPAGVAVFVLVLLFLYSLVARSYGFVQFLAVVGTIVSLGIGMVLIKDHIPIFRSFFEALISPINAGISYLEGAFTELQKLLRAKKSKPSENTTIFQKAKPIIIGIFLSIPILILLVRLFSQADPIYSTYVASVTNRLQFLFNADFWKNFPDRIIISIILTFFLIPFVSYYKMKKSVTLPSRIVSLSVTSEISVVLFIVIIVLASFLAVQWKYIFINVPFETDLSQFGIKTYSEYVNRGFFELIWTSLIVYSLSWAGLLSLRGKKEGSTSILKVLQIVLLLEFTVLLLSMFRRIFLYQELHGWTLVRIYGGFFLIYISFLTLTLFLRIIKNARYIRYELLGLTAGMVCVMFFNAEGFIATAHPPTVNKQIDYVYLARMSSDGYTGWKMAYDFAKQVLTAPQNYSGGIINREERRRIAYSANILGALSGNYDRLIRNYATDEELKNYYLLLYKSYRDDSYADILTEKSDSELMKNNPSWKRDWFNKKIAELTAFDSTKGIRNFSDKIFVTFYLPNTIYYTDTMSLESTQIYKFNDTNWNYGYYKTKTGLDRVFMYNAGDYLTYEKMKSEIPVNELISQVRMYRMLFEKILFQPENERDYDTDISTNSPLL